MNKSTASYMLIFRDTQPESYQAMSAEQRQKLLNRWNAWYDGLEAQGKVDHGHPLESEARTISGARGEMVVDGPFAESKEAIAGYFIIQVDNIEEATAIAQACPNLAHGMAVEVRRVGDCCHFAQSLGRTTMRDVVAS